MGIDGNRRLRDAILILAAATLLAVNIIHAEPKDRMATAGPEQTTAAGEPEQERQTPTPAQLVEEFHASLEAEQEEKRQIIQDSMKRQISPVFEAQATAIQTDAQKATPPLSATVEAVTTRNTPDTGTTTDIRELSTDEIDLIARIVWVESRGEPDDGQRAVIEVILNRLDSPVWPDTLEGVLGAEDQFTSWATRGTATPTEKEHKNIAWVLNGGSVLGGDKRYVYFNTAPENDNYTKIGNHYFCRGRI